MGENGEVGNGWVSKKVRRREEEPPDEGGFRGPQGTAVPQRVSFKDVVMQSMNMDVETDDNWEVEDMDLHENDVSKIIFDGVPTIDFSERVYD